jgi:hypothetical protein
VLSIPPPARVAFGTIDVGGQKVEFFMSIEWARYFQTLNNQVVTSAGALTESAQHADLLIDSAETPDFFPLPGPQGERGPMGPALFLMQEDSNEMAMPVPPLADGVYVPVKSKDAADGVPGLTQLKLNLKNVAGTISSWLTNTATAARTWTMPDKDGTVAVLTDFAAPPAIGNTAPAAATFTALNVTAGFGCNGKGAQAPAASGGTLAGVIAALVANGILSS